MQLLWIMQPNSGRKLGSTLKTHNSLSTLVVNVLEFPTQTQ